MTSPVFLHILAHSLVKHLPVFGQIHINEVDNDDSSHIAQAQLAGQFVCCAEINVQCISLLSAHLTRPITAVHIHNVQSFGMFDDKISTVFVVDGLSEARFDLFGNVEIVKDRRLARVQFHDASLFRGYQRDIVLYFFKHIVVIDVDVLVSRVEKIAQQSDSSSGLFKH